MWEDKENYVFGFDWDWIHLIITVSYLEATNSRLVDQWMNVDKDLAEEDEEFGSKNRRREGFGSHSSRRSGRSFLQLHVFCVCDCAIRLDYWGSF